MKRSRSQGPDGYIGAMAVPKRMWGLWDIHEMGYIIYALTSDYHYFGQRRSLDAARKAADYILARWRKKPADWPEKYHWATSVALTGVERTLLALYREMRRPPISRFLRPRAGPARLATASSSAAANRSKAIPIPISSAAWRNWSCTASCRTKSCCGSAGAAVHFLTAQDGMTITGAAGVYEIWTDDQDGHGALGETCSTAYQLRLYDSLLRMEGNPRYGDLIERTIYNALFAAQSPDGRRIRYFVPMEGQRQYFPEDNYCCPGNYRRIVADLADDGLLPRRRPGWPSISTRRPKPRCAQGRRIAQGAAGDRLSHFGPRRDPAGSVPAGQLSRCNCGFRGGAKKLAWLSTEALEKPISAGEFLAIEREWSPGDRVTLEMPM